MNAGELVQRSRFRGNRASIWIRGELKTVSGLGSVLQTNLDSYSERQEPLKSVGAKEKRCLFG